MDDPRSIVDRTIVFLEEWQNAQELKAPAVSRTTERWCPPAEGWFKANADGALVKHSGNVGDGAVVRDLHGTFVSGVPFFPVRYRP